jgi:deoxyadenosine/deoxycytidine kinase
MIDKDPLFAQITLNSDELKLYQQIYAHLTLDAPRPDLVIYLQAPLATLRERIALRGIGYEQQIRDEYLLRLSESYTRFFHDYDGNALLTINTESVDLINNAEDYQAILEKINDIRSGRHYFNQSSFAL